MQESDITQIFEEAEALFWQLAQAEDRCASIREELDSFKEGSPMRAQKLLELQEADRERIRLARQYNICLLRIDRIKVLLSLKS